MLTSQENAERRNPGIDTLRGVAILMVMLLHFSLTYGLWRRGILYNLIGHDWAFSLLGWGNFAVTIFFVVSGFLIATNTAERAGNLAMVRLRPFYVRRFARLAPCLLLALTIITVLGLSGLGSFATEGPVSRLNLILGVVSVLLFFHNVLMQHLGYFDYALNVYWSLSVEEVFYLFFPIVCVLLRRDWLIALPCLVFIFVAPFYRAAHGNNDIFYLYANLSCFDAISIGCLTAILAHHWLPSRSWAVGLKTIGWVTLTVFWIRGFEGPDVRFSFTVIALSTAAIILGSVASPATMTTNPIIGRALRWLGRHSYELYLFHIIVLGIMRDILPGKALSTFLQIPWLLLFVILSAGVAAGVARAVGDPANAALRRRLLPSHVS